MKSNKTKYIIYSALLCLFTVLYLFITPWPGISFTDTKDTPAETAEGNIVAGITSDGGVTVYYEKLQAAIDAAADGDTIDLLNNTAENIESGSKSYTLEMNGYIIDGNSSGRVYNISGGTVTLRNGTLTNGYANTGFNTNKTGSGLNISNANVTLEKMKITGNNAGFNGGGIYFNNGTLTITESEISGNVAASGGGIYSNNGTITVADTTVSDNTASNQGGGIYSADIILNHVDFERNTSASGGVALYISRADAATVNDCTFDDNHGRDAEAAGSSIITAEDEIGLNGGNIKFNRCTVTNNDNIQNTIYINYEDYYYGYGYEIKPISATFTDCVISGNEAYYAAGIRLHDASLTTLSNTVTLENTVVKNNRSFGTALGEHIPVGGVSCNNSTHNSLIIRSGAIYNNTSDNGKANDLFIGMSATVDVFAACNMADGGFDFSNYVWRKSDNAFIDENDPIKGERYAREKHEGDLELTAFDASLPPAVLYNDVRYDSIPKAIAAAKERLYASPNGIGNAPIPQVMAAANGSDVLPAKLELVHGEDKDGVPIYAFYTDGVIVDIPIDFDTGECSLNTRDDFLFAVIGDGSLTLRGSELLKGVIDVRNDSVLTLATDMTSELEIKFSNENASVAIDPDYVKTVKINIELDDERANALITPNETEHQISYVLMENARGKVELANVNVTYNGKPLVDYYPITMITFSGDDIIALNPSVLGALFVRSNGGDDSNSGISVEDPLKTVEAAIDRVMDPGNSYSGTIYLLDTLENTRDTWDGGGYNIVIKRFSPDNDFGNKNMITVKGSLTLRNITIDGCGDVSHHNGSIIKVTGGAELILDSGAVLTNNDIVTDYFPDRFSMFIDFKYESLGYGQFSGGAVYVGSGSSVFINEGSTISNCTALLGGGVFCLDGTVTMNGGDIKDNTAVGYLNSNDSNALGSHYTASGGGICVTGGGSEMYLNGGTISGNHAGVSGTDLYNGCGGVGGGLSIGTGDYSIVATWGDTAIPTLFMNGGDFTGNFAVTNGGGLFIQQSYRADIFGGSFTYNECGGGGNYGGGAIYVNGGKHEQGTNKPVDGEMWLKSVLIRYNQADDYGGGIAGCNTSGSVLNSFEGSVIYDNTAICPIPGQINDGGYIPCDISSSTSPTQTGQFGGNKEGQILDDFTQYMLDDTPYHWKFAISYNRYKQGDFVPDDYLYSDTGKVIYTDERPLTEGLEDSDEIQVRIEYNTSRSGGGGIGTNGSVYIGGEIYVEPPYRSKPNKFTVTKQWIDDVNPVDISDIKELDIWVFSIDRATNTWKNRIHNHLITDGKWLDPSQSVEFAAIDTSKYIVVVLEDVKYTNGEHVWSVSRDDWNNYGELIEAGVQKIMETMYEGEPRKWAHDGFAPFVSSYQQSGDDFTVTNTSCYGKLKVSKTVTGNLGETERDFHFTVTLKSNTAVNGTYGDMTFDNNVASFTLKHGESKTAADLPAGIGYEVVEEEAGEDNYITRSGDTKGQIPANDSVEAYFINDRQGQQSNQPPGQEQQTGQGQQPEQGQQSGQAQPPEQDSEKEQVQDQEKEHGIEFTDISVTKIWYDDNSTDRPKSVTVQLYRNDEAYGDKVILNEGNNWKHTWSDLEASYSWSVKELGVPEGYYVTITHEGNDWTVINSIDKIDTSHSDENSVYSPNTGVDPISIGVIMLIVSLIAVLAGKVFFKRAD